MKLLKTFFGPVIALAVMMMVSSCGASRGGVHASRADRVHSSSKSSSGKTSQSGKKSSGKPSTPASPAPKHIDFATIKLTPSLESLLREADSWIGTPYLYGGNDRNGIDCSGFVSQVFRNSVGVSLPRTSRDQHAYCRRIERETMEPGDLVFFTIRGGDVVGHVGIYIGNDLMVHASSSKGVIISSLASNYYVVNYFGSGRVDPFYTMASAERSPAKKPAPAAKKSVAPKTSRPAATPAPSPAAKPTPAPPAVAKPEPAVTPAVIVPPVQIAEADETEVDKNEIASSIASRVSRIGSFTAEPETSVADDADDDNGETPDFFD